MAGEEKGSPDYKVIDRRSFSADGARKEDAPASEGNAEAAPERPPEKAYKAPDESSRAYADTPPGFETLVSYLSTTAMFQLGLIPGPSGEPMPVDTPSAKRTIDLLEVLQEKTAGNLSEDESHLLEDVLYELRMTFVEMQKRQAQKSK